MFKGVFLGRHYSKNILENLAREIGIVGCVSPAAADVGHVLLGVSS